MNPDRPGPSLLRSPVLWIGLLVMIFLGWAWRDSVTRWSYLRAGSGLIQSQASGVIFSYTPEERPRWDYGTWPPSAIWVPEGFTRFNELTRLRLGHPEFRRWRMGGGEWQVFRETGEIAGRKPDPIMALIYHSEMDSTDPVPILIFLPYWCLMLAALVLWLGLIYWRYRRNRRSFVRLPAPSPDTDLDEQA